MTIAFWYAGAGVGPCGFSAGKERVVWKIKLIGQKNIYSDEDVQIRAYTDFIAGGVPTKLGPNGYLFVDRDKKTVTIKSHYDDMCDIGAINGLHHYVEGPAPEVSTAFDLLTAKKLPNQATETTRGK